MLHARAEDVLTEQRFNTLVVRAVARLKKLLEWFRPHWDAFDRLLVLKGPSWVEERGEARHYGLLHDLALRKLASYPLPGTESESVLLQIRRKVRVRTASDQIAMERVMATGRLPTPCMPDCQADEHSEPADELQHDEHDEHEADDPQGHAARMDQDRAHLLVPRGGIDQADGDDGRHGVPEIRYSRNARRRGPEAD